MLGAAKSSMLLYKGDFQALLLVVTKSFELAAQKKVQLPQTATLQHRMFPYENFRLCNAYGPF